MDFASVSCPNIIQDNYGCMSEGLIEIGLFRTLQKIGFRLPPVQVVQTGPPDGFNPGYSGRISDVTKHHPDRRSV